MGVEYACYLLPRPCSFRPPAKDLVRLVASLRERAWVPSGRTRNLRSFHEPIRGLTNGALGLVQRTAAYTTPDEFRSAGFSLLPNPLTAEWLDANLDIRLLWSLRPNGTTAEADDIASEDEDDHDLLRELFGLRYPLRPIEQEGDVPYYDLSIHWAEDYIVPGYGETMITATLSECSCGGDLERGDSSRDKKVRVRAPFPERIAAQCPKCGRPFDAAQAETRLVDGFDKRNTILRDGGVLHRFAIHVDCGKCFPHAPPQATFHSDFKDLCQEILGVPMVEAGYMY